MTEFLFKYWKDFDRAPYLIWYCFCTVSIKEDPEVSNIFYKLIVNYGPEKLSRNFWALNRNLKKSFNKSKWENIKKFPIHKISSRDLLSDQKEIKSGTFLDKLLKNELK